MHFNMVHQHTQVQHLELDRIVMLIAKEDSIRQVIAFPKNKKLETF